MSDRDRRRAFAAGAACLIAAVVALLVLGSGGSSSDRRPSDAATRPGSSAGRPDVADVAARPAAAPAPTAGEPAPADQPAILPAGQALPRADVRALRADPPTLPAAVTAAARRFVTAYLTYELGDPPAALHDRIMRVTGGRLRAALQHEPPRRPLGDPLEPARLSALDGRCERRVPGGRPRCTITYVARHGRSFLPHSFVMEQEGGRWLAIDLIG